VSSPEPASPRPIVAIVGAGVTGSRVAEVLATPRHGEAAAPRIALIDRRDDLAQSLARSVGGVAVPASYAARADAVVLAHATPHAATARGLLADGVPVVSLSDDVDDVRELLDLARLAARRHTSLVVGAAMAPGLSGLLARHLAGQMASVDEVHVAMHGTGGPACARQHHNALSGTSIGLHDGAWIERPSGAGRELCWFPEPVNAYDCYRASMPDPLLLHRVFPEVSRISARMSATRRDRFTARLPMLSPPHREGGVGAVRVDVRGSLASGERESLIAGVAVRSGIAAGVVAATMTQWLLQRGDDFDDDDAMVVLGDPRLPTAQLLDSIRAAGVTLYEFTGLARPPGS